MNDDEDSKMMMMMITMVMKINYKLEWNTVAISVSNDKSCTFKTNFLNNGIKWS